MKKEYIFGIFTMLDYSNANFSFENFLLSTQSINKYRLNYVLAKPS